MTTPEPTRAPASAAVPEPAPAPEPASAPTSTAAPGAGSHSGTRQGEPASGRGRHMVVVTLLVSVVAALALSAFAWPAARTAPRDLPLGLAGPTSATAPVEQRLRAHEGAFEIHRYADEAAARAAIKDRTVYGAIVVGPDAGAGAGTDGTGSGAQGKAGPGGPKLLTATAAGPLVAQLLQQTLAAQAPAGQQVVAEDVVAAPPGDPRGSVLGASVLPLAMAGVAAGAMTSLLRLRGLRATGALLLSAAAVGLLTAALAHSWLGALSGDWWAEAGALALSTLAVSAPVAGLAALLGTRGIGAGAFLMVLLGNPFSGVASAPQLLPEPVGLIGQLLPPGAGGSLLRSVSFFDGAAAGRPLLVLGAWAVLGVTAVLAGAAGRRRRAARADDSPTAAVRPGASDTGPVSAATPADSSALATP